MAAQAAPSRMNAPARWLLCVCLLLPTVAGALPEARPLQERAERLDLAHHEAWLALGHYRRNWLGAGYASDADDPGFFLAAQGKTDPAAELKATLAALLSPGSGDRHPQCRFPARARWLQQRLHFDLPERRCKALAEWRSTLKAHAVSLIFPTAYLNSPSSMFGHTFLRLDREGQTDSSALLAYTLNYAAEAVDENELFYAYRGLFGGYPGALGVRPYYDKIKEYRDFENRDIWEYRLNLSPAEVAQLVDHSFELQPVRFDYYFIGENCSYRLLALLDVARPGLRLREEFPWRAIPADTVRAIVAAQLVADTRYRPSAATVLTAHADQLSGAERRLAKHLRNGDTSPDDTELTRLAPMRQAAVLETAYESERFRALDDKLERDATAKSSLSLLRARSRIAAASPLKAPQAPAVRDDQGHKPAAFGLGAGFYDHRAYGEIRLRSAYHELTDPWPGYRPGAQIALLDGSLRYYENNRLQLERLDAVNIRSLSPRSEFIQPLSWSIGLGAYRRLMRDSRPLLGSLSGEVGWSYPLAGGIAYAMAGARLDAGGGLESGAQIGLGPRAGWLYRGLGGQGMAAFELDCYLIGSAYCGGKLSLRHAINLGRDLALSFNLSREQGQDRSANELGFKLTQYF